jgi:nickel-dependent lactate racemase
VNVELPYGETTLTATLPGRTRVFSNTEAVVPTPVGDLTAAVGAALAHPLGLPRLGELAKPSARVTIAFDDATVPSYGPIRTIAIEAVLAELAAAGVARGRVSLVCANALHRKLRPAELARIIGARLVAEFGERLSCHDAEDPDGLVDLGRTPEHGYPVVVNRCVTESDLLVYVNAGHMRGFNGGWKSVCVGLSTYDSIRVTHTPDGMSMSVHGNRMD